MKTIDKLSAWVLDIYAEKNVGAKVLQSILNVLPEEFICFRVSESCPEVAYVTAHDGENAFTWCIHLEEDVDLSYVIGKGKKPYTALKYPIDLIR